MWRKWALAGLALLGLAIVNLSDASVPTPPPYPRIACYGMSRTSGYPWLDYKNPGGSVPYPPLDTAVNQTVAQQGSRFGLLAIEPVPTIPYRPDIAVAIKSYNPRIKLVGYINICNAYTADTLGPQGLIYSRMVGLDARVYSKDGNLWINCGQPGLELYDGDMSQTDWADSIADIVIRTMIYQNSGVFDGVFFDVMNGETGWLSPYTVASPADTIDAAKAGWTSEAQMDSAGNANVRRIYDRIKAVSPYFLVMGNGTTNGAGRGYMDGWLWEGFAAQNYTSDRHWRGIMAQYDTSGRGYSWIKDEIGFGGTMYSAGTMVEQRYDYASAALGDGFGFVGTDRVIDGSNRPIFMQWVYDELSVNVITGHADTTGAHMGWLGNPIMARDSIANGLQYRKFKQGMVVVNPYPTSKIMSPTTGYMRIVGQRNPTINNGITGASQTIPANDALFLVKMSTASQIKNWFRRHWFQ